MILNNFALATYRMSVIRFGALYPLHDHNHKSHRSFDSQCFDHLSVIAYLRQVLTSTLSIICSIQHTSLVGCSSFAIDHSSQDSHNMSVISYSICSFTEKIIELYLFTLIFPYNFFLLCILSLHYAPPAPHFKCLQFFKCPPS